ncbi:MAG TPA: NUDIX hydrolase [Acidimicrobiia bacterium]|nr:NUDIX hydrolase [Acidimicrobiia bacterium]
MSDPDLVIAAGGIVLRPSAAGPEVLVIHRQRYDDWTLPKGKSDPDEAPEQTALREVREETGVEARLIASVGVSRYPVQAGEKLVHWFAMRPLQSTDFQPNDEVDGLRWMGIGEALGKLTYGKERDVLSGVDAEAQLSTGTLFLVRHGVAGSRSDWKKDDRLRPLSNRGEKQALGLARTLAIHPIDRILTSPYLRCRQTVKPLADKLGIEIEEREELAEGEGFKGARDLCRELAGTNAVLCSHGDVIPALLDWMARHGMALKSAFECKKGSTWEIEVRAGEFRRGRYWPPPD